MIRSQHRHFVILGLLILLAEWLWVFKGRPSPVHSLPDTVKNKIPDAYKTHIATPNDDIFDYPAVNSKDIRAVCDAAPWRQDLVFTCDNSVGGVGNLKNSFLICVRFSISAGAAMTMPKIIVRDATDIAVIRTGQRTTMDYLFDTGHFVKSLKLSCPQLKLYEDVDSIPNSHAFNRLVLQPEDLQSPKPATGIARPETWNDDFKAWLSRETAGTSPGSRTTLVALGRSYLVYPIHSDPEGFHSTFGNIIKFRSDTRQIASAVFKNLVDLSPTVSWDGRSGTANGYMGIHLRTEKDAREGWPGQDWVWSRYETQSRAFLNQTIKSGLKTIYVASGDLSQISQLKSEAQSHGIEVKDKFELLSVPNRERLQSMPWDQQGLVDFLVLLKSQDFAGIAHSSFAWAIALKRHQMSRRLGGDESYLDGPQMLSDEFSQVYGQVRGYPEYAATLWP